MVAMEDCIQASVYHIKVETKWSPFSRRHFKCIFLNENVWISITISLKFVPKGPINIIQTLVQIMTWRRPGDKPLSEPMMVRLLTHICVTQPQWVMSTSRGQMNRYIHIIWFFYHYVFNYLHLTISWIQSCSVTTRSNKSRNCIHYCNGRGRKWPRVTHYSDVTISDKAHQITGVSIICPPIC